LFKTRRQKTNGEDDAAVEKTAASGERQVSDEFSLLFGGRASENIGFFLEPSLVGSRSIAGCKMPFMYSADDMMIGIVPISSDWLAPAFGGWDFGLRVQLLSGSAEIGILPGKAMQMAAYRSAKIGDAAFSTLSDGGTKDDAAAFGGTHQLARNGQLQLPVSKRGQKAYDGSKTPGTRLTALMRSAGFRFLYRRGTNAATRAPAPIQGRKQPDSAKRKAGGRP
jgi:hypothetical protein